MNLPIDARRAPFKPKYLEDETFLLNRWMVFGQYSDGTVGVCDGDNDIFEHVDPEVAARLVAARNAFVDAIMKELADHGRA